MRCLGVRRRANWRKLFWECDMCLFRLPPAAANCACCPAPGGILRQVRPPRTRSPCQASALHRVKVTLCTLCHVLSLSHFESPLHKPLPRIGWPDHVRITPPAGANSVAGGQGSLMTQVEELGAVVPCPLRTHNFAFVHLADALWTPEIRISDPVQRTGISLSGLTSECLALRCTFCGQGGGAVMCALSGPPVAHIRISFINTYLAKP